VRGECRGTAPLTAAVLQWAACICISLRTSPVVFANMANCVGQQLANTCVCEQFVCADCRQTDFAKISSPVRVRQLLANSVQTVSVPDSAVQDDPDEADGINFGRGSASAAPSGALALRRRRQWYGQVDGTG
jgi:hypothetical protein